MLPNCVHVEALPGQRLLRREERVAVNLRCRTGEGQRRCLPDPLHPRLERVAVRGSHRVFVASATDAA